MRKFSGTVLMLCMGTFLLTACKKVATPKLVEKVFVVNIVQDSAKFNEYLNHHKHVWPEVEAGFKKAGYKKITLYRYGHLLVMMVVVPEGANLDEMSKVAESYSPRCAEWNKMMNQYQVGVAGAPAGATWVEALPFYSFTNP